MAVVIAPEHAEEAAHRELVQAKVQAGIESAATEPTVLADEARRRLQVKIRAVASTASSRSGSSS